MNKKLNKISVFTLFFSLLFCLTAFVFPTVSKYITITNAPFGEEDTLDYTVNAVFVVHNQDELFAAINQGYTYVQLSKDIENPLIVTEQAQNLDADLILDLNGIEIQRNGYDPILNIKENVRLTVVDTSAEQTGGLYNPVGSVFNITGGILTVVAGTFESGPRYSEYYSYNTDILNSENDTTKRTIVETETQEVNFFQGGEIVGESEIIKAPIIKSYPTVTGDITYNHGNLYFDHEVKMEGSGITITPDTYCYYRTSEDKSATNNSAIACDWYYTYWVTRIGYDYVGTSLPAGANEEEHLLITIYGYENAINKASSQTNPAEYYAAIQMQSGMLEVQSGGFYSYFGVDTTACVNSQGGEINVKAGNFSSRIPDAIVALDDGVNIKESDEIAFETEYFPNYRWSTQTNGNLAQKGEAYCILNGGESKVTIGNGKFYSSNNSTIHMAGGELDIGAGSITKKTTVSAPDSLATEQIPYYSAIYMGNGNLSVKNVNYNVYGDKTIGMCMQQGLLNIQNAKCNLTGNNVYGIISTVSGEEAFTIKNASFTFTDGNNQTGIYSQNGTVNISSDVGNANNTMSFNGENAIGISVEKGGSVKSENYSYSLSGNNSIGIYASEDATGITVLNGKMTVKGEKCFGIKSFISGDNNFIVQELPIEMTEGTEQTAIYSENGTVRVTTASSALISISDDNGKGIHIGTNGSVISTNYSYKLNGDYSHGIYSTAGTVELIGGDITLESNVSCYGVYAFSASSTVGVQIQDCTIDVGYANNTGNKTADSINRASVGVFLATSSNENKISLTNTNVNCYEVGVLIDGGSLEVKGSGTQNQILTRKASSIIVKGGGINFDESCNYVITSSSTRNDSATNLFNITLPTVDESVNDAYDNYDGIYVSGGTFTSNGNINIAHTGLLNDIDNWISFSDIEITSWAVRVEGGAVVINKGSITNSVGGGVMCNGGDVTLGNEQSQRSDISITTTGNQVENDTWESVNHNDARNDNSWDRRRTYTGGHAMEINNGNLVVYEGSYLAAHGDGIKLNAPQYSGSGPRTTVTIHNGSFDGQMENDIDGNRSGPAGCYGVKVYGPAIINIFDGVFNGRAGGACVGGAYQYNYSSNTISYDLQYKAEVYIHKAKFGTTSVPNDGFMIYDNSKIVFGVGGADVASPDAITVNSNLAAFSVNWMTFRTYNGLVAKSCDVSVYYGTYSGSFQGWNKNNQASQIVVYNVRPGLTIRNTTGQYGDSINDRNNPTIIYYPTIYPAV